jgi:hypothetical protein
MFGRTLNLPASADDEGRTYAGSVQSPALAVPFQEDAKRLLQAGLRTFAALACASASELQAIVKPQDWQKLGFESWTQQAKELAEWR